MQNKGRNLGVRKTFADVSATIADNFNVAKTEIGVSFLNEILNYVLNYDIPLNLRSLFEQIKEQKIITYKHKEWIGLGAKLHTALQDIKLKGKQDLFVDEYIYKLSSYRFLLTVFAYDI